MIQLTTIADKRILIDIKDIRAVLEKEKETAIFLYSDKENHIPVKEDFEDIRKTIILNTINQIIWTNILIF